MNPPKNPHAAALAKKRWENVPAEKRSEAAAKAAKAAAASMTPAQRSERARKAALARYAKKK